MIQRIQTLYLLISTILGVVCLSLPLGQFFTAQNERYAELYNLWISICASGDHQFTPWALFALLLAVTALTLLSIFLFRTRALQMRTVVLCMVLLVGYYAWLGFLVFMAHRSGFSFRPSLTAALPLVCIILDYLAFRGILKDELLVRSLDRLR